MTSQLKTEPHSGPSGNEGTGDGELERLRARLHLLESNYADLEAAARVETELKDREIARLRERAAAYRMDRILQLASGKSTSLLRRVTARFPYLTRARRRVLKFIRWCASIAPETVANRPGPRAEQSGVPKSARVVFDERTCLDGYQGMDEELDEWPKDRPLVTVVVTSFNDGDFVAEAVDSVLAQTFDDIEIIVVEGGSTDAASKERTLALKRPKTKVIAQQEPYQVGANRNFGIREARGKYICCLNADDLLRPTYIEKAVFLLETAEYDVVSCAMQQLGYPDGRIDRPATPLLGDMLEGNRVLPCAVFRKGLWYKAGGYRDADRSITGYIDQDWLFWARLAAMGARLHNMSGEHLLCGRHGPGMATQLDPHAMAAQRKLIQQAVGPFITPAARRAPQPAAASDRAAPIDPLINLRGRSSRHTQGPSLLLVLPATVIGGAERLLSGVVAHLAKQGWRVTVLTTNEPGANGDSTSWFEITTPEIFHLPRFLARTHWPDFIAYLVASRGIDAVWIAGSAFLYNLLPALRTSFPNIRVADILFNTVGHTENNRKFAKLIDFNFVENNEVLQFLLNAGESPDRVLQVSSGIDLQEYEPGPREASVVNLLNVTEDELIVGFSGRWGPEKDPLMFVEIARRLSQLPIHFVMTGVGPLRPSIEAALAAGKLGHRFHLVGEVEDVRPWITSFDALVLPSRFDGRPVVVLEALALGVPVIASAVGGLSELVDDGVNGFLCVPGMAEHFVGKIARLARDRELLARLKKAARSSAEQKLDSRRMLASYEQALRDLVRSGKRPVPHS